MKALKETIIERIAAVREIKEAITERDKKTTKNREVIIEITIAKEDVHKVVIIKIAVIIRTKKIADVVAEGSL